MKRNMKKLALALLLTLAGGAALAVDISDRAFLDYCERGDLAAVKEALASGADVNAGNGAALHRAIDNSHAKTVEVLVKAGADVNARIGAIPALWAAANNGNLEIVETLLKAGADVNVREYIGGSTALVRAAYNGNLEIVETLVKAGADVNARTNFGDTALSYARNRNDVQLVKFLIGAVAR